MMGRRFLRQLPRLSCLVQGHDDRLIRSDFQMECDRCGRRSRGLDPAVLTAPPQRRYEADGRHRLRPRRPIPVRRVA